MKTKEQIRKAIDEARMEGVKSLIIGGIGSSEFVGNTSASIALEWVLEEGDDDFNIIKQAKKSPLPREECADTDGDGECDTHDHSDEPKVETEAEA